MKKKIFNLALMILTLAIVGTVTFGITRNEMQKAQDNTYATTTIVVDVDYVNDTVACEDCNGNVWEMYGAEDWQAGDFATLTMNTCGTTNIYDDEIINARYSGNVEGLE